MPEWKHSHNDEGPASSPPRPLASWYAQGLSDGLGDRLLMFDNSAAPSLELLRFRPDLAQVPGFEAALRDQVHRVGRFRHPAFAQVRSVQRLEPDDDLALISNCTPGKRLSEVLHRARGPAFAAAVIRQLAPALALFQQHDAGISHGVLSPDRIVVSPEGRLTIVEHVVGPAIDMLGLGTAQLTSIGIALPPAAGGAVPRFDVATDWYQLGLVAVSVLIGRPVTERERPQLEALLGQVSDSAGPDGTPLSPFIRQWLERALQISGSRIESGADARAALDELLQNEQPCSSRRIESVRHEQWALSAPDTLIRAGELLEPPGALAEETRPAIVPPTPRLTGEGEPRPTPIAPSRPRPATVQPATRAPISEARRGSISEARAAAGVRQRAAQARPLSKQDALSPFEREVLAGRIPLVRQPNAATVRGRTAPAPPPPQPMDRWRTSTSVIAALALIGILEAGVIAWLAHSLWVAPQPAIVVETAPSSENVVVHSETSAPAPLRLAVAPDLRWVRVSSPAPDDVRGGEVAGTAAGAIQISSPITLKVFEGARLLGSVPGARIKVPAGRHDIELVNAALGFRLQQAFEVEPGQTVSIHVAPQPGWVTIDASPWAEVSIDGQVIGRTPLGPLPLAPGEHQVTFRHPTGGSDLQRVTVKSEATSRLIGKLRP